MGHKLTEEQQAVVKKLEWICADKRQFVHGLLPLTKRKGCNFRMFYCGMILNRCLMKISLVAFPYSVGTCKKFTYFMLPRRG